MADGVEAIKSRWPFEILFLKPKPFSFSTLDMSAPVRELQCPQRRRNYGDTGLAPQSPLTTEPRVARGVVDSLATEGSAVQKNRPVDRSVARVVATIPHGVDIGKGRNVRSCTRYVFFVFSEDINTADMDSLARGRRGPAISKARLANSLS